MFASEEERAREREGKPRKREKITPNRLFRSARKVSSFFFKDAKTLQ